MPYHVQEDSMYQKLIIAGNLGGDPEMRYTPSGQAVTNFSVATNRKWSNPDGSQAEEVTWFRVTAWGKLGETCNQYLSKGRAVLIEGRLNPDKGTGGPRVWTGQDGQPRASFEVTAETVKFLGGPRDGGHAESAPAPELGAENIPF
jgi:single-strand DNA-binding protein